jgi:endonuclease/exonuclease/phosphatase family metal-dependent hydrolase
VSHILTWNIQCGRGVDDRVDLERTADVIKDMADADVICLQEVSRFDTELDGGIGADQVAVLSALFPDHVAIFGPALDRLNEGTHQRRQFGNLILSRLPVIQIFNHLLPQPAPAEPCKHMPRQALEVVIETKEGPLRITTTHLEFHCAEQRLAQAGRIRDVQAEVLANLSYALTAPASGPYAAIDRPARSIICGDFNSAPDDTIYQTLTAPITNMPGGYRDAWRWVHNQTPHAPTCGIYDHNQWPEGPHCRDFFFISEDMRELVSDVQVQIETDASDHQPVLLSLKN